MKTPVLVGHHGDHGFLEQFERLPVLRESVPLRITMMTDSSWISTPTQS